MLARSGSAGNYSARTMATHSLSVLLGVGAALVLAWCMSILIHSSEMQLSAADQIRMLDFVRLQREETAVRKDRKPQRPEMSEAPEAPPAMSQASGDSGQTLAVSAPSAPAPSVEVTRSGIGLGASDGEYLPIVKVAPIYPRRALERGLTGTCLVRYTVTTAGTVRDVQVVDDQCSDPIFARPSEDAARRFKYKPRVIDGVAVEVIGIHNMFHYERGPDNQGGTQ